MKVRTHPGFVLVKWIPTQASSIIRRPDKIRRSGTENADATQEAQRVEALPIYHRSVIIALNMQSHKWMTPEELVVEMHTNDLGEVNRSDAELRGDLDALRPTLDALARLKLIRKRGRRYHAHVISEGLDVGRVISVSDPDRAQCAEGDYVLFDKGTGPSFGWPASERETDMGQDASQAIWASHKLAALLDDPRDIVENPTPGHESGANFYFFIPTDRLAVSLGPEPPPDGMLG